jgi:pimeloyl-ACP methyl ester carboxylesterase
MDLIVNGRPAYAYTAARVIDPELPSVLFVHGAASDHSVFLLQSRYFAYHQRNSIAVDLPGHGRSVGPPLATIPALADWVVSFLDAAGLDQAVLVGHSMGSLIALECAARHPKRVCALALIGTSAPMPVSDALMSAAQTDSHAALDMLTIWGLSPIAHIGGNTAPGLWMAGTSLRLVERAAPQVLYTDLRACNEYQDGLTSATKVTCPTLFLLGSRDVMTPPRSATDLRTALPGAQTIILDRVGHSLMAEHPNAVLDALIPFVGGIDK